jgi:RNA polymerase sigma-70 factor (ECF subfamily)
LRSEAAADDLAQEVLLLTIQRLRGGEVQKLEQIGSFILGTSRMMCQAEHRITRRREALTARFGDTAAAGIAPPSMSALDGARVAACLRSLADRERLVLLLTYYAEREAPRIAEDLNLSPGTVRVIRHRAIARLRECVTGGASRD